MSVDPVIANYNGKQPNRTAYIKNFVAQSPASLWTILPPNPLYADNGSIINASPYYRNVIIQGDLTVNGTIYNPSDVSLKQNIDTISDLKTDRLLSLDPVQYTLKMDTTNKIHYGFIAQEIEKIYPELVTEQQNIKIVNYIELIPLLVSKIQKMEKEIQHLKERQKLE